MHNGFKPQQKISELTAELNTVPVNAAFIKKYHFKTTKEVFTINSLNKIGIADPFPDSDRVITCNDDLPAEEKLPEVPSDMVYGETRYIDGFSPYCIYIPQQEIMFKLMRACIGVKDEKDLWFNR